MRVARASEDEEVVRSIGRRERAEFDGHRQGHGEVRRTVPRVLACRRRR